MSSSYDEGPVYYREIQKNAYLKRIPNDISTSKLRPLGHKKPPLKPMWTLFCVHNGRTPFLEQYPDADSPNTLAHKPLWRACLKTARHVTASVKPHVGDEYDFLVDTDHGPVRMLAPDWDSMQDWVTLLRNKLHELRILSRGENVYGAPPVAPPPRAAARDPTSPLPPTPPVPPDRVPGIELTPITRAVEAETSRENITTTTISTTVSSTTITTTTNTITPTSSTQTANIQNITQSTPQNTQSAPSNPILPIPKSNLTFSNVTSLANSLTSTEVDISNWEPYSLPSTSREAEPKSIKVCGQNICLDDSIFKRDVTDSDEEFFNEVDRIHDEAEQLQGEVEFKQRVVVNNEENTEREESVPQRSNVTVIQVSNKGPPHTAIPVLGPETDVFDFEFKQKLSIPEENNQNFVNIVNTETNNYGTVFDKPSEYGHLSLTTTVSLTGDKTAVSLTSDGPVSLTGAVNNNGVYERLCMASTSNRTASPLSVRRVKCIDKVRKSSLPNLEIESDYEYLFPSGNTVTNISNGNNIPNRAIQNGRSNSSQVGNIGTQSVLNNGNTVQNEPEPDVSRNIDNIRLRSNVERSQSQNAYDIAPRRRENRVQNNSPKREGKNDKPELHPKPIWRRGLTELSLLSRLRGIAQTKRQESPTRNEQEDRGVTSPAKVVHRSRPAARVDSSRRRSNSLTNSQSPSIPANPALQPLRARQVAALRAEQRRGACVVATVPVRDAPLLCEYEKQVWIARWGISGYRCGGRVGDRLAALAGAQVTGVAQARQLLKGASTPVVDLLFHRVPLGKIYVVYKKDRENLGIKLDNECTITSISAQSPASRAGLPARGKWTLTEINNRPLGIGKGCEEEMNRLACNGTEVSILIQPAALVKKIRAAIKASKPLLGIR